MVNTNTKDLPRKWYWAGFLSYLVPGLGQIYNGLVARGLLYYCLFSIWGSCLFVLSLNAMKANFNKLNVILLFVGLFIALIIFVYIIVDAIRQAKKQESPYHLKSYNKWTIYILAILIHQGVDYVVSASIRDVLIKPYRIPTASMDPTLITGDLILNNKLSFSTSNPKRGDVVIFQYPPNEELVYVKRIIGLPGDTLFIKNKEVFINRSQLDEPYVIHIDSTIHPIGHGPRDHFGPSVVPSNRYFVLGDNRDNSLDSRYWGTVERNQIKGIPRLIYLSLGRRFPFIRFQRIGKMIN